MRTRFTQEDKARISAYSLEEIGRDFLHESCETVAMYERRYEDMRRAHPQYCRGWHSPFTSEHRFVNRVILQMYADRLISTDAAHIDYGCYDAMLVAVLRENGISACGVNTESWSEMWRLLVVDHVIFKHPDSPKISGSPVVVSALNYCHNWTPVQFLDTVFWLTHGAEPDLILMDREARTPHANNALWMDDDLLAKHHIEVIRLPNCDRSIESRRDLLIWEK